MDGSKLNPLVVFIAGGRGNHGHKLSEIFRVYLHFAVFVGHVGLEHHPTCASTFQQCGVTFFDAFKKTADGGFNGFFRVFGL